MFAKSHVSFVIASLASVAVLAQAAPASKKTITWKLCKPNDPNFQQCFTNELQSALPQLSDGYAKFRIPPIDPFDLPSLDIAKGAGAVSVDLSLQKLKIYGLSSAIVKKLEINPNELRLYVKLNFAQPIVMIGQYIAKGKVQVLPINGKGPCNITFVDPTLEISDVKAELVEKNGQKHINIKDFQLKSVYMGKLALRLDNLFQGNKEISDNLNVFLNENWQLLYEELKPAFEEAIKLIVQDIANKVLMRITRDEIFPQ